MVLTTDPALAGAVRKPKDNSTQHGPWREAGTPGQGTNHIQEGEWVSGVPREATSESGGLTTWSVQFGATSVVREGSEGLGGLE